MQNLSYGYRFYLQVKENLFSYERFCTWPRFEKEVKSNSEMGHWVRNFYCRIDSRVLNNGWSSNSFQPQRGVRHVYLFLQRRYWPRQSETIGA